MRWLLTIALLSLVLAPVNASSPPATNAVADGEAKGAFRLREGAQVDLEGRLELSGDRAVFYPQEGEPLRVLENLALERVMHVLSETREPREWLITGTVTEYCGANYILLLKAVQRAKREKPAK